MISDRQIFVHGNYGEQKIREVLCDFLVSLMLDPDELWLVSPWVTDFNLLDNRTGEWDGINPGWGSKYVTFAQLLGSIVESGSTLNIVNNAETSNHKFQQCLSGLSFDSKAVNYMISDTVHTKGFLSSKLFLAGSMNFTYSGGNRNDELVKITVDPRMIAEARLEFETKYLVS